MLWDDDQQIAATTRPHMLFTGDECREVGRFFSIAVEGEANRET